MNEACSVVFVHSPFVVLFEGKVLSLWKVVVHFLSGEGLDRYCPFLNVFGE